MPNAHGHLPPQCLLPDAIWSHPCRSHSAGWARLSHSLPSQPLLSKVPSLLYILCINVYNAYIFTSSLSSYSKKNTNISHKAYDQSYNSSLLLRSLVRGEYFTISALHKSCGIVLRDVAIPDCPPRPPFSDLAVGDYWKFGLAPTHTWGQIRSD